MGKKMAPNECVEVQLRNETFELWDEYDIAWFLREIGYEEVGNYLEKKVDALHEQISRLDDVRFDLESEVSYWEGVAHDVESSRW